jgi:hypothetical protein
MSSEDFLRRINDIADELVDTDEGPSAETKRAAA